MAIEITLIQLVTICAVINGLTFSFLLFNKKENQRANLFLSLMILSMCVTYTPYMLDPSFWLEFLWLSWIPFSLSYWIGPAFYLYVKTLTQGSQKITFKELWHFSPIILNYVHSIYHFVSHFKDPFPAFHDFAEFLETLAIASILIYMILSLRLITSYQKSLLDSVSNTDHIDLKWIKRIIAVVVISFIAILIFLIVSGALENKRFLSQWDTHQSIILLIYTGILYWLSISGFRQAQIVNYGLPRLENKDPQKKEPSFIVKKLNKVMEEEKLYRNPELNLYDLSKATGLPGRSISEALNHELNKNFYRFINEYRVEEVKQKLKDPAFDHLKILSLALDAGFNSKASFHRVFKSYTGLTPKEFKSKSSISK